MSAGGQSCCWGMVQLPRGPSGFPLPGAVPLCHGEGRFCLFWVTLQWHSVISSLLCHLGQRQGGPGDGLPLDWATGVLLKGFGVSVSSWPLGAALRCLLTLTCC